MLLIVTVGLVLAGIVLLVIGLVQDGPGYIYASMACAVLAALTLFVFSRLARRSAGSSERSEAPGAGERASAPPVAAPAAEAKPDDTRVLTGPGVSTETVAAAPEPEPPAEPAVTDPTFVTGRTAGSDRVAHGAASWQPPDPTDVAEEPEPDAGTGDDTGIEDDAGIEGAPEDEVALEEEEADALEPVTVGAGSTEEPEADTEDWDEDEWDDEFVFPIEDYDDLRVAEILPILGELEDDELIDVRDREAAGKARGTILRRIETLLGGSAEAAPTAPAPAPAAPAARVSRAAPTPPPPAPAPAARVSRATATPPPPPAPPAPRRRSAAKVREPIPGYESLRVAQILPLLGELSHPDLATIEATERAGSNRATVLKRIDRLRAGRRAGDDAEAAETAPATVASVRGAGRGTPARSTGRAAAKKAAPGRPPSTKAATAPVPDPAAPPPEAAPGPPATRATKKRR